MISKTKALIVRKHIPEIFAGHVLISSVPLKRSYRRLSLTDFKSDYHKYTNDALELITEFEMNCYVVYETKEKELHLEEQWFSISGASLRECSEVMMACIEMFNTNITDGWQKHSLVDFGYTISKEPLSLDTLFRCVMSNMAH